MILQVINRACCAGFGEDGRPNWDVDIIAMLFGFYLWQPIIDKALRDAFHNDKIVLAAASNNGTRKVITFPPWRTNVICIHSANGDGTSSNFNPDIADGKDLSIIGEHVESAWRCGLRNANEGVRTDYTRI
jgi:hypothetical protein